MTTWNFDTMACAISLVLALFFILAGPWPAAVFFAALALFSWKRHDG